MSMQVPVELLPEVVRGYGQSAYAVVSLSLIHISEPTRPY